MQSMYTMYVYDVTMYTMHTVQGSNVSELNYKDQKMQLKDLIWTGDISLDIPQTIKQFLIYVIVLKEKYIEIMNLCPNF